MSRWGRRQRCTALSGGLDAAATILARNVDSEVPFDVEGAVDSG